VPPHPRRTDTGCHFSGAHAAAIDRMLVPAPPLRHTSLMDAHPASIRTPDQRIRVFLSSTLRELEPERDAARAAIESLHLAPVMFELGARPHPPRSLYRAYLAQSDIFVGVYWQSYGWVAPDEQISGLEDEYRLSSGMPHLIYIKQPAPEREARLEELLGRIRADDTSSYRGFATPAELAELITADLATLLADRFDASRAPAERGAAPPAPAIPAPFTSLVGRTSERDELVALLAAPGVRIVTVVGPGGIGKSRLAIDVAETLAAAGREVAFATLESVTSPDRVISVIARAVGVRETGDERLHSKLIAALAGRDMLIVVDNMEQVLEATDDLVRLITELPRLQLLVTSRSPLRVRAERTFELGPLDVPEADATSADAATTSAVALFVERARAINPAFRIGEEQTPDVAGIVRALDGVPLAIELAAARTRTMSAKEILARLDSALSLLVGGARDLPERQRTVRSTIEWSVRLLDDEAIAAFEALSAFSGPFTFEAAEAVLGAVGSGAEGAADAGPDGTAIDPYTAIEALLDASLLWQRDRDGAHVFGMLVLVRAFARERAARAVAARAASRAVDRWVSHYVGLAAQTPARMRGTDQLAWMRRLDAEAENLASVMRHLLDAGRFDEAAEYAWSLYLYLWIGGLLGVVRDWMAEVLDAAEGGAALAPRTEAIALYYNGAVGYWQDPAFDARPALQRSAELFDEVGDIAAAALSRASLGLAYVAGSTDPDLASAREILERSRADFTAAGDVWGEGMALVPLGRIDLAMGDGPGALERFEKSLRLASSAGELLGIVIAQHHRAWPKLFAGDVDGAEQDFAESLENSLAMRHDEGIAYGLEGLASVRAARGQTQHAGLLVGAAARLRRRTGIQNPAGFALWQPMMDRLRAGGEGDLLDAAIAEGESLSATEVMARVAG
jgi:predicted ATPase